MEVLFGVIVGLIILMFLVAVHELGHALAARRNGVGVDEFGIGFPPRAWGRKLKNGTLVTLNWLPLGGFVRLQGEYDSADKKGDYGAAGYLQKTEILLAGVAVNWVVAAVLMTVLAWVGLPKILPNQYFVQSDTTVVQLPVEVAQVVDGSPADEAGLERGDRILTVAGEEIATVDELAEATKAHQGERVQLLYERGKGQYMVDVELKTEEESQGSGYLGVAPGQREVLKAGWSAPVTGVVTTAQFSWETLVGVKNLLANTATGLVDKAGNFINEAVLRKDADIGSQEEADRKLAEASASVAGPVGILGVIFPAAAQAGITQLLFLTAIISLTLAIMNILPIPALDGGRWAVMTVFRALGVPLTKEREETIQAIGFLVLMGLIVVVTLVDIGKFF